jgi:hypothetical protein
MQHHNQLELQEVHVIMKINKGIVNNFDHYERFYITNQAVLLGQNQIQHDHI